MDGSSQHHIAILGAGGFIGSHLVGALAARGDLHLDAVDTNLEKLAGICGDNVTVTRGSIRDHELLRPILDRCDTVVSLTALCNPSQYNTRPIDVIDASYGELVPLCDLCTERDKWLIHFSSCEVYGRHALQIDDDSVADSGDPPAADMSEDRTCLTLGPIHMERWTYASAKQLLERRIWALGKHHGLRFTIVRPFNVIGPRMDFIPNLDGEGLPRVLACFMHALMIGAPLALVDGGERRRSFIAIDDFIDAVVRLIDAPTRCVGEVLNIGNPINDVTIAELARMIAAAYGRCVPDAPPATFTHVSGREFYGEGYDDSIARLPNIDKAQALLDWTPRISLADALPGIVDDYVHRYAERLQPTEQR